MSSKWNAHTAPQTCFIYEQLIIIGQSFWYSTTYSCGENGMVEYCTVSNQIKQIINYPKNIKPLGHCLCESNGNIYIIDGENGQIILFNAKTKQFSQTIQIPKIGRFPSCMAMNDNIHIFHGKTNRKHLIYSNQK